MIHGCQISLKKLGLDYIDLYLIHSPFSLNYQGDDILWPKKENGEFDAIDLDLLELWRDMEKLADDGLVKSIGVSNFNSKQINYIVKNCRIKPTVCQIESNPGLNQTKIINFCNEKDIRVLAYSPLGHPKPEKNQPIYLYDKKVSEIAKKYKKTVAQVILRYSVEMGTIPITKSGKRDRMYENLQIFDFTLTDEDMDFLKTFANPENRIYKFPKFAHLKDYPYNIEF